MTRETSVKSIDREQATTAIQETVVKAQDRWKAATAKQRKIVGGVAAGILLIGAVNAFGDEDTTPVATTEQQPASETTSTGLGGTAAQAACDLHADQAAFPYEIDVHWMTGKYFERVEDDTYFFKVQADVTSDSGGSQLMDMECRVAGTNDAPQVVEFNAY